MRSSTFGGQDQYYSAWAGQAAPPQAIESAQRFESLINDGDYRGVVQRVIRQWNNTLREQMRAETGLRLSVGDDVQAVPVRIVDGLPKPLFHIISQFSPDDLRLLLNRPLFSSLDAHLPVLTRDYCHIAHWLGQFPPEVSRDEVQKVRDFVHDIAEGLEKLEFERKMRGIDQDVLGAYYYNIPEVRLYWVAIAMTARFIGLPVEALAFVVATHELAHALLTWDATSTGADGRHQAYLGLAS